MKKLYEGQKHSIYELQKALKLDKMRLYRYVSGQFKIDKMPISLLNSIAKVERMDPNELFVKIKDYQERRKKNGSKIYSK